MEPGARGRRGLSCHTLAAQVIEGGFQALPNEPRLATAPTSLGRRPKRPSGRLQHPRNSSGPDAQLESADAAPGYGLEHRATPRRPRFFRWVRAVAAAARAAARAAAADFRAEWAAEHLVSEHARGGSDAARAAPARHVCEPGPGECDWLGLSARAPHCNRPSHGRAARGARDGAASV